jgi:multisubunit Na+/H+ antiporter MnhB subunit
VKTKAIITNTCFILLAVALFFAIAQSTPSFGSIHNLTLLIYLPDTLRLTGALNTVAALVWDWRGYDTLGETTVFFAAAIGTALLFRLRGDKD